MKSTMGIQFWKNELIKKFELNEIGKDLLNLLIYINENEALKYILSQFQRYYRVEIINLYCEKYNKQQINKILKDLDEEELNNIEIKEYGILDNIEEFDSR